MTTPRKRDEERLRARTTCGYCGSGEHPRSHELGCPVEKADRASDDLRLSERFAEVDAEIQERRAFAHFANTTRWEARREPEPAVTDLVVVERSSALAVVLSPPRREPTLGECVERLFAW
jgi:hypothetical protein